MRLLAVAICKSLLFIGAAAFAAEAPSPAANEPSAAPAIAPETSPPPPPAPLALPPPVPKSRSFIWTDGLFSTERRADERFVIMGAYAPFDLLLPHKIGLSVGWIASERVTYELEWLRASYGAPSFVGDVGSVSDQRVSLLQRAFFDFNSFNLFWGVTYFTLDAQMGGPLLSRIPTPITRDSISYAALGATIGIGNRWTLPYGATLGVDWIAWAQPLIETKRDASLLRDVVNSNDHDQIEQALRIAAFFPRFSALKVELGWSF